MTEVDVECTIGVREVNEREVDVGKSVKMTVRSHWNREELVILEFEGKSVTVGRKSLMLAIENATNTK